MPKRYEFEFYDNDDEDSFSEDYGEDFIPGSDSDSVDSSSSDRRTRMRWVDCGSQKSQKMVAESGGVVSVSEPKNIIPFSEKTWEKIQFQNKTKSFLEIQEEEKSRKEEEKKLAEERKRLSSNKVSHKRLLQKDDPRLDLLCIYGPKHNCRMAHDFTKWQPKFCRFSNCKNGPSCIYWHSKTESLKDYLVRCCTNEKSFFYKNRNFYSKYYLDL